MVVWLAIACSLFEPPPLTIREVTPGEAHRDAAVHVVGEGFVPPLSVSLVRDDVAHELLPIVAEDATAFDFQVPRIAPGPWVLSVARGDRRDEAALTILPDPEEVPCARGYQANTEVSLPEGVATVVRFWPDGRREHQRTALADVRGLEYARRDGCSAIWFRLNDGSRVLFEDGRDPLDARATTLSSFLGKELRLEEG